MGETITVHFLGNSSHDYLRGTDFLTISQDVADQYATPIVAVAVNHEVKDLQTTLQEESTLEFFDLGSEEGMRVYQRSLVFILVAAAQKLYPQGQVAVMHSLSQGIYCELQMGRDLSADDVKNLKEQMGVIIAGNWPITRKNLPREEAIRLFAASGQYEKLNLLKQLDRERLSIYECGPVHDYFYGTMVPSAGYLNLFELTYYEPGLILSFPQKERPDILPAFVEQPKLAKIFSEAEQWAKILQCAYVANLNEYARDDNIGDIIRVAEALHEKKLAQIADYIYEQRQEVRLILVAGPSSSGKTTFAQRLGIQLRVNGLRPIPISLDDYFVDRPFTPLDENGSFDFEAIEAIDLELFNEHLSRLLHGEEVGIPTYNFFTGQREYRGRTIKLEPAQALIIEGIHGLNERLTQAVPRWQKAKIYVSALTQLSIDNHNRIPTTDTRLIRRIVRDSQFRSHDALQTLQQWPSVRRGEDKNIFPFQEEADVMFNSALIYELGVLKQCAEPLLEKICIDSPEYSEARRLLNFLSYFSPISEAEVPSNSILREFLGKSCFFS